jgi:hypothetical protein
MDILTYIEGLRKGKEAHDFEREAMNDPFLYEAVDGYDSVNGDSHFKNVKKLRRTISRRSRLLRRSNHRFVMAFSVAACLLAILMLGIYILTLKNHKQLPPTAEAPQEKTLSKPVDSEKDRLAQNGQKKTELKEKKKPPGVYSKDYENLEISEQSPAYENFESIASFYEQSEDERDAASTEKKEIAISKDEVDDLNAKSAGIPLPVGGAKAYRSYLEENRRNLDSDDDCSRTKGKVILFFHVNKAGRPYNIVVFRSLCQPADQEAIRLVTEGPDWTSGNEEVRLEIDF